MKKIMQVALICIGVVLLSVVSSLGIHYGMEKVYPFQEKDTAFVHAVALQAIDEVTNPSMESIAEIWGFHAEVSEEYYSDSIFANMPVPVLTDISKVILGRQGFATQKDIVDEYRANYLDIYQYLDDPGPENDLSNNQNQNATSTSSSQGRRQSPAAGRAAGDTDTVIEGTRYRPVNDEEGHE